MMISLLHYLQENMLAPMMIATRDNGEQGAMLPDDLILMTDVANPPMSKVELETIQINYYKKLIDNLWPDLSFEVIGSANPPDFLINRNGEKIGVDMVALANSRRKQATAEFWGLRERLRAAYNGGRLRRCKNLVFAISFATEKFPPARTIENSIAELINIFDEIELGQAALDYLAKQDFNAPLPYPFDARGATSCGTIAWMVEGNTTLVPGMAHTSLMRDCGFEVRHNYNEWVLQDEVIELLNKVIASHDKSPEQKIDELVIVAGGPDKFGDASNAESSLVFLIREWKLQVKEPKYIKRIVLLDWCHNSLQVLFGELGRRKVGWISRMDGWKFSPLLLDFRKDKKV